MRKATNAPRYFSGPAVLVAAALTLAADARAQESAAPGAKATVKVEPRRFRIEVKADGQILPALATPLAFRPRKLGGEARVLEVFPHGQRARGGDVLLRLDTEDVLERVQQARWQLREAEVRLRDLDHRQQAQVQDRGDSLRRAERDVAWAEQGFKAYRESVRPADKDDSDLGIERYRNQISDQEDELAQLETMYKEDELTEETEEIVLKRSRRDLAVLRRQLDVVLRRRRHHDDVVEPRSEEALREAVETRSKALRDLRLDAQSQQALGAIDREKAERAVARARAELEGIEADLQLFALRAPHDGVVLHGDVLEAAVVRLLRAEDRVSPGSVLLTVARDREEGLKARFSVDPKQRFLLSASGPARVRLLGLPQLSNEAAIDPLPSLPAADGSWVAFARFRSDDDRVVPLLRCEVVVVALNLEGALVLPLSAITSEGGRSFCFVRGELPFGVVRREVELGPDDGKHVLVRSGLRSGDEVYVERPAGV
jgi:multidrug resistance efflux pump